MKVDRRATTDRQSYLLGGFDDFHTLGAEPRSDRHECRFGRSRSQLLQHRKCEARQLAAGFEVFGQQFDRMSDRVAPGALGGPKIAAKDEDAQQPVDGAARQAQAALHEMHVDPGAIRAVEQIEDVEGVLQRLDRRLAFGHDVKAMIRHLHFP